eukprot:6212831-Pleurochrysis_carterae.AAC.2
MELRGGPVVRLSTSTECATAYFQKEVGAPLATRFGSKLPRIVAVDRSHNSSRRFTSGAEEGSETGEELSYVSRRLVLVPHHVHSFESGVIVHDDQS